MIKTILLANALMVAITPALAQTCNSSVNKTTQTADFVIHGDGTVTHTPTGLMWMQCSVGQAWATGACTGTPSLHTWPDALQQAESQSFASHEDWRVPNIKELSSIAELSCYSPAINLAVFPGISENGAEVIAWSSSPEASYGRYVWGLNFYNGLDVAYSKNVSFSVRLVRGQ